MVSVLRTLHIAGRRSSTPRSHFQRSPRGREACLSTHARGRLFAKLSPQGRAVFARAWKLTASEKLQLRNPKASAQEEGPGIHLLSLKTGMCARILDQVIINLLRHFSHR